MLVIDRNDAQTKQAHGDEGFLLLGALVLVFLVLLALTIAAPRVARQMQREKEIESAHRANQYVRAIRIYYKKLGHYPGSVEQLQMTNNQRFLREKYIDPLTGKDDWRLIHFGENKTKVKGFFGQDLPGLQSGLGAAAGMASSIGGGSTTGTSAGTTSGSAFNNNVGSSGGTGTSTGGSNTFGGSGTFGGTTVGSTSGTSTSGTGTTGTAATGTGTTGTGTGSGISSQSATSALGGGGGLIIGVGSSRSGEAMVVVNEQNTYETWEFLYDPRIEQLYAKANLLGGGISAGSASSISGTSTPGSAIGASPSTNGASPTSGTAPTPPSTSPTTPP